MDYFYFNACRLFLWHHLSSLFQQILLLSAMLNTIKIRMKELANKEELIHIYILSRWDPKSFIHDDMIPTLSKQESACFSHLSLSLRFDYEDYDIWWHIRTIPEGTLPTW